MNIHDTHPMGEVPQDRALIERLSARLGLSQPQAEQVAGAVLGPLEEHLTALEAEALEAELSVSLRRAIHRVEGRRLYAQRDTAHPATAEELSRKVAGRLQMKSEDAHLLMQAVFDVLRPALSQRVRT